MTYRPDPGRPSRLGLTEEERDRQAKLRAFANQLALAIE
jgi:hypothetical protein